MPAPLSSPSHRSAFARTERQGDDEEAIKRMFSPEFRNRLDAVIRFAALSHEVIGMVVDKFVIQLEEQLADRKVTIELSTAARPGSRNTATIPPTAPGRSRG